MSIKVILQAIDGSREDEVLDPGYVLAEIWPIGDPSFPLLQYIDPYGSAIFTRQQIEEVIKELNILLRKVSTDEQKKILLQVRQLAERCKERPHWLLRFRGD